MESKEGRREGKEQVLVREIRMEEMARRKGGSLGRGRKARGTLKKKGRYRGKEG